MNALFAKGDGKGTYPTYPRSEGRSLLTPGTRLWLEFFAADVPSIVRQKLSTRIRSHEKFGLEVGARARVVRARFSSPGFVTIDGSRALGK